jgi:uncharacterized protein (TIGR02300 family)
MASKDMGTKYLCFKCNTKFYDLKRPEPLCPKCGADQRESPALRAPEKPERKKTVRAPVVVEPVIEEEAVDEEAAEEEDAEDAAELPDDADEDV